MTFVVGFFLLFKTLACAEIDLMRFLSLIVFTNLFLLPILFHPLNVCRHLIHIGHEPFHPKPLRTHSYESYLYRIMEQPQSYLSMYSSMHSRQSNLQRAWNYLLRSTNYLSKKYFYPNLISYTEMFTRDHDLSPLIQSFLFMYLSYFILTYVSSLVHVHRMLFKTNERSLKDIRHRAQQLIDLSYARWIVKALGWKALGVLGSHVFYLIAVKIVMQSLFISYGHFRLDDESIYSSWNLYSNLRIIHHYEGWTAYANGLLPRMLYELSESDGHDRSAEILHLRNIEHCFAFDG